MVVVLLVGGAYMTWGERKICARFQVRYGPNLAGPFGILQPLADAVKAIFKEEIVPRPRGQGHLCHGTRASLSRQC